MALSNLFGWAKKMARLQPRPAALPAAAGDKPRRKARGLRFCLRRWRRAGRKACRLRFCLRRWRSTGFDTYHRLRSGREQSE